MPEVNGAAIFPPEKKTWTLGKSVWVAAAVTVLICTLWYLFFPSSFPHLGSKEASGSVILFLEDTVTDAQGIPYAGTVLYEPTSEKFSYIATGDPGQVTPVGPGAFSSGTYFLAMRTTPDSNEFVLYDYATLSPVRVIQSLESGRSIAWAIWSPDGKTFAYSPGGALLPPLTVESADSATDMTWFLAPYPLGFSPDGSKIMVRGEQGLSIMSAADGSLTQVSGISAVGLQTKIVFAPSGNSLAIVSDTGAEWYIIDWEAATLSHAGTVPFASNTADIIFTPDDSLLVWKKGGGRALTYSYEPGKGVKKEAVLKLPLPEGARILHVVSW